MSDSKYPVIIRSLHWIMAVGVIVMLLLGYCMAETNLSRSVPMIYFWHKSIGVLMFFLIIIRILVHHLSQKPALPITLPILLRFFAKMSHVLMYILLVCVPFSGYIMSNPKGVPFFGLVKVPVIFMNNNQWTALAYQLHAILAYSLAIIVVLHIIAVIMHQLDRNPEHRILKRMKLF